MEFINRVPQNAVLTVEGLMRHVYPLCTMGIAMGLHVRVGQEDNLYGRRGERATVRPADREDGATSPKSCGARSRLAEQAREIYRIGTFYSSVDETLEKNGWLPNRKPAAVGEARSGVTKAAGQQAGRVRLRLAGVRADVRPADFRLYGAAGAERRLSAAEGGMAALPTPSWVSCPVSLPLMVGVLTCPISLLADRLGRVRSIAAMALLWSIATLLCGLRPRLTIKCSPHACSSELARRPTEASASRSSSASFQSDLRATLTGAFMAGGLADRCWVLPSAARLPQRTAGACAFLAIGVSRAAAGDRLSAGRPRIAAAERGPECSARQVKLTSLGPCSLAVR